MDDVISATTNVNALDALTRAAQAEHLAVGHALGNALQHAMNAGDALLAARKLVPDGKWLAHLRAQTDISERSARVYVQVATNRARIDRQSSAGPISIAAALEYLREPKASTETKRQPKTSTKSALDTLAWSEASLEEQTRFLDGIGLLSVLNAAPPEWRAELERRVGGHRGAAASPLSDKVTKALKAALSHSAQKTSQDNASALASLNGARNLLAAQGLDLHDVEVVIRVAARPGSGRARAA